MKRRRKKTRGNKQKSFIRKRNEKYEKIYEGEYERKLEDFIYKIRLDF